MYDILTQKVTIDKKSYHHQKVKSKKFSVVFIHLQLLYITSNFNPFSHLYSILKHSIGICSSNFHVNLSLFKYSRLFKY